MTDASPSSTTARDLSSSDALAGLSRLHRLVFVSDAEGRIRWLSSGLGELCSTAEEHVGCHFSELLPELDIRADDVIGAFHGQHDRVLRGRSRLGDAGAEMDACLFGLRGPGDGSVRIIGALRPVDAEGSGCTPGDATSFLAAILENAPDAVVSLDRSGFINYANRATEQLTGKRLRELIDRPALTVLENSTNLDSALDSLQLGGDLNAEEIPIEHADGTQRWVSVSSRMIQLPDGRRAGTVCFIRDATERKQIQEKLERKNAELESYVHSVSHDLRSPLVSLLGFSRLLREDYGETLDETGLHFLDRVEQAGRTMQSLIHDLLELSRIGQSGECRTLVDPRAVLLQIEAELKLRLDEHGVELTIPNHPALVFCDRTRLYQVLSNLIGNALAHMGPCESPKIRVRIEEGPTAHHISVADNGKGIAAADQERIFDVFTSLGQSQQRKPGSSTGIGLAIVRKIVETHEGRVWVESSPGQGTRFHFTLPHR